MVPSKQLAQSSSIERRWQQQARLQRMTMIRLRSTSLPSAVTASNSYSPLFKHSRALSLSSVFNAWMAVSFNSLSSCWMSSSMELINDKLTFVYVKPVKTFFIFSAILFIGMVFTMGIFFSLLPGCWSQIFVLRCWLLLFSSLKRLWI